MLPIEMVSSADVTKSSFMKTNSQTGSLLKILLLLVTPATEVPGT